MRQFYTILTFVFLLPIALPGQKTVGLLSYEPSLAYDGYNLMYPHNQPNVYLFNNCGEIVHVWEDSIDLSPGNTAYLLEDGRLVKTKRPNIVANDRIWAGGGGATVEIRDWDNNLMWSFTLNNDTARLHHDIEVMPNGNILMIGWEIQTLEEAIAAGRDSMLLDNGELWTDFVIEVNPELDSIVWEWHVWDHIIQDFDSTKANYGVVADHPELLNVNFARDGVANWQHTNAISFNSDLNQIALSSPFLSEIYIIDHSTTTQQAAGHVGGLGARGGDFMYRWGNPQAYDQGTADDQVSFFQHDVHWLEDFIEPSHPLYGKLVVFNNNFVEGEYSTVSVIDQPWDMYTWSYLLEEGKWGPVDYEVNFTHPDTGKMYSNGLSSVQLLPNDNYLVCVGATGYSFEITPEREIVWEYVTPLLDGQRVTQGDSLEVRDNITFRIKRYPTGYPAFADRDLSAKFYLELNPDTAFCDMITAVREENSGTSLSIFPNPARDFIQVNSELSRIGEVSIYNLQGQLVKLVPANPYRDTPIDISQLLPGIYVVRSQENHIGKLVVQQ
ncbi:MAG: aryl-sulfate sulfotransferase [Saprospiraceae bacterium]|nr:aryl-sulfate sulfotransferase [Saprospiraceae bacterium]